MPNRPAWYIVDVLLALLLVMLGLVKLANYTPPMPQKTAVKTEGRFAVISQWDVKSEDDVDLYVQDPEGNIVYFASREAGLMHLERDDLGYSNDTIQTKDGQTIIVKGNEERVIIRGIVPGEYIVNVHMYRKVSGGSTHVKILLLTLQGRDAVLVQKLVVLKIQGDERTAFRFTVKRDGSVTSINQLSHSFTSGR